jgi:hypothetical protein
LLLSVQVVVGLVVTLGTALVQVGSVLVQVPATVLMHGKVEGLLME